MFVQVRLASLRNRESCSLRMPGNNTAPHSIGVSTAFIRLVLMELGIEALHANDPVRMPWRYMQSRPSVETKQYFAAAGPLARAKLAFRAR